MIEFPFFLPLLYSISSPALETLHTLKMSTYAKELNAIIIGAGPAGIAMAYRLKHELDFHDFTIFEKLDGVGGTWRANSYPGWYV